MVGILPKTKQSPTELIVDDIIFGSAKKELCIAFKKLMHEKFQMSSMGKLTFFLGLQVKKKKDGHICDRDRYMRDYAAYEQFVALCEQEAEGSGSAPRGRGHTYLVNEKRRNNGSSTTILATMRLFLNIRKRNLGKVLCKADYYANQLSSLKDLVDLEEWVFMKDTTLNARTYPTPLQDDFYLYYLGKVIPTWVISASPNADRIVDFRQIRAWTYLFQTILPILQSLIFGTQAEHLDSNSLSDYSLSDFEMLKVIDT
ncbi:hypothetical protein Tco_0168070 [Tanacetum coccineum]